MAAAGLLGATGIEQSTRIVGGHSTSAGSAPYMVSLQPRALALSINSQQYEAFNLTNSPNRPFRGPIVDCGRGTGVCQNASQAVCLIERGGVTFTQKVYNCAAGGGVAAVIYNHLPGQFGGTLAAKGPITAVAVSRRDGQALLGQVSQPIEYRYAGGASDFTFCGGVYIGERWVATAAHCVKDLTPDAFMANVGSVNVSNTLTQKNLIGIEKILVHGGYQPANSLSNDVALLHLAKAPDQVTPLPIATATELSDAIAAGQMARALGHGIQQVVGIDGAYQSGPVKPLYEVMLPLVSNDICQEALTPYHGKITEGMVCAGRAGGGQGTCFGDSGGPLTIDVAGQERLIGLTSWGIGCALPNLYDVYARMPFYNAAVEAVMSGEKDFLGEPGAQTVFPVSLPKSDQGIGDSGSNRSGGSGGAFNGFVGLMLLIGARLIRPRKKQ